MNQERKMDMQDNFFKIGLIALIMGFILAFNHDSWLRADTGHEGATRKEIGSYINVRSVNLSTTTGTNLFAASVKRPDGTCTNNSAYVIWVGTDTGTYNGVTHPNLYNGTPILSSQTFKLDGSMTGNVAATADTAAGASTTVNVRCIDGLVR